MKPVIIKDLDEAAYHSQVGQSVPLFSYSTARTIIQKSAYHAWEAHPLLGGKAVTPTKAMDRGSLIHSLILGSGPVVMVIDADSYRTNVAKEARDEAQKAGQVPMLIRDNEEIQRAVVRIKEQIFDLSPKFFGPHDAEVTIRWEMDNGVKCQSRLDNLNQTVPKIFDLKTTNDASTAKVERKIFDMGYDIQYAMYTTAVEKAIPESAGRFGWEFIFIETEPPYMVSIIEPDSSLLWLGEARAKRAASIWKRCLSSDKWPGYGRQTVTAPAWAVNREEMESDE